MITAIVVPAGPYMGYTLAELETELTNYKTARTAFNSALSAASMNGSSFQFAALDKQRGSLAQIQIDLQDAFAFLDPGRFPVNAPSNIAAAVIR